MISASMRTYLARIVRRLTVRGRSASGWYSCEGYQSAPDEPQQTVKARRAGHFGFVSEMPDGGEAILVAVNGGDSRVAVADLVTDDPALESGEVCLWTRNGQRILLDKDGNVVIYPKSGGQVLVGDASVGNCDPIVTKGELNACLQVIVNNLNAHTHSTPSGNSGISQSPLYDGSPSYFKVNGSPNAKAKKQP